MLTGASGRGDAMIFRQLFDPETSTYSYLLADEASREAVLIDPVLEQFDRDSTLIRELDLRLTHTLETHVHADHVTASGRFRERLGSKVAVGDRTGVGNADLYLRDRDVLGFGAQRLEVRSTPGHTQGCVSYVLAAESLAFTGDALLIRGCGRTDFQGGDAAQLFRSVRRQIFSLPEVAHLYPGHDYKGRTVTTIAEEKRYNARLALDRSEAEFVAIMHALDLAYPKRIDVAVPANLSSGLVPEGVGEAPAAVADAMQQLGRQDSEHHLGLGI
jgi:glyoxylase-like metal-dependent hydrolase (beta-lactamase superfamily II)